MYVVSNVTEIVVGPTIVAGRKALVHTPLLTWAIEKSKSIWSGPTHARSKFALTLTNKKAKKMILRALFVNVREIFDPACLGPDKMQFDFSIAPASIVGATTLSVTFETNILQNPCININNGKVLDRLSRFQTPVTLSSLFALNQKSSCIRHIINLVKSSTV